MENFTDAIANIVLLIDFSRLCTNCRAVDNANAIPGYDDAAVQTSAAVGQR